MLNVREIEQSVGLRSLILETMGAARIRKVTHMVSVSEHHSIFKPKMRR
jgi:hypothetical protein